MTRPRKDGLKRDRVRRVTKDEQIVNLETRLGAAEAREAAAKELLSGLVTLLWESGGLKHLAEIAIEDETSELDERIQELEDNAP